MLSGRAGALCRTAVCGAIVLLCLAAGSRVWSAPTSENAGTSKPAVFRVRLVLPGEGWYVLWATSQDGSELVQPQRVKGKAASVDLDVVGQVRLHVLDEGEGTVAHRDVKAGRGLECDLSLSAGDFAYALRVPVRVLSGGKAVSSALVVLRDAKGERHREVLLPGQGGVVTFSEAALGRGTVEVQYGDGRRASQDVDIAAGRGIAIRPLDVHVASAPHTEPLERTRSGTAGEAEAKKKEARPAAGSDLTGYLVALGLVVFLILLGYYLVRSRVVDPQALLARFGVKAPEEARPAEPEVPPVQVPPGICPFCGTPRDPATGACACTVPVGAACGVAGPRLVVLTGPEVGTAFVLDKESLTLGRDVNSDIAVAWDPAVSRRHAVVSVRGGEFEIADQGSSNGTFVNGARVERSALRPGDVVTVGQTQLRFEL
ncbi:MAG: FHA domain-containing protein [Armatimonadota bacterium]